MNLNVHIRVRPRRAADVDRPIPYVKGQYPHYEFDAVYDETNSQREVFTGTVQPLVDSLEQGMDSLLMVYGAPGAGKTYSLVGPRGALSGSATEGLIQQAAAAVFRAAERLPHEHLAVKASYTALTAGADGGFVFDLLTPGAPPSSVREIRCPGAGDGATLYTLDAAADVTEVLRVGQVALTLAAEAARPSGGYQLADGAHACLTLHLERRSAGGQLSTARLHFVELAAPDSREEGAPRSAPAATRAKATAAQALQSVARAVHDASARVPRSPAPGRKAEFSHIPWRDTPLTVWLKAALFGSSSVTLLACIHATSDRANDTIAALSWASRVRPASNGKGVMVTPTWGNPQASSTQARTLDDRGYTPTQGRALAAPRAGSPGRLPAGAPSPYRGEHSVLSVGISDAGPGGSPHRSSAAARAMDLQLAQGSPPRDRSGAAFRAALEADADTEALLRQGLSPGGALARVAEMDMEKVSELLDMVRQSGLPAARVLRGQAVLQRMAEALGDLRRALATSKGEARSLRKQLQEVVLRLDESREKTGDAHFMVEALKNEQERLLRDHSAALDATSGEMELLRGHLRTTEKERESLLESLQADRRAREAAERDRDHARKREADAERALADLTREKEHHRTQAEELRDQVARAAAEVSDARAKGREAADGLLVEKEARARADRMLDEANAALRVARAQAEKVPSLERQLSDATAELRAVREALNAVGSERRRLASANAEAEDRLGAVAEAYESALVEGRELETRMKGEVEGLADALRAEGERSAALVEALSRSRQAAEEEADRLRADLEAARGDAALRRAELARVRAALDAAESRLADQARRVEQLEEEVDGLEGRLRAETRAREAAEAARDRTDAELDAARREVSQLSADKAAAAVELGRLERDLAGARGDAQDARSAAAHEREMKEAAEARGEDLSADLRDARDRVARLEAAAAAAEAREADLGRRLHERAEECAELSDRAAAADRDLRRAGEDLEAARAEAEALRQEAAALSGRHEAKVAECEAVRDAKAALERESLEAVQALEGQVGALEDRGRQHRRLLAELSLLMAVEGVGVQSDFASPVVAEMVVRQCRDMSSRARQAGRAAGDAGTAAAAAARELEARLEATAAQAARAGREADARVDEWRRKCEALQRAVAQLERDAGPPPADAEAESLRARLADEERRVRLLEARVREMETEVRALSPGRERAGQSEARAALRQVRALEDELDAARRERQRADEARERAAREAAAVRAEFAALQAAAGDRERVRALEGELAQARRDREEALRQRAEADAVLAQRGRLDQIVETSRLRAAMRLSPGRAGAAHNASTVGGVGSPGAIARSLDLGIGSPGASRSVAMAAASPSFLK